MNIMLKYLSVILFISCFGSDCWMPIIFNTNRSYVIKNQGKAFKPLYSENEFKVNAALVIDGDTARTLRLSDTDPFPMADTLRIDVFDNEVGYAHTFSIVILKDKYSIRYMREINYTEFVQKFESVESKLELSSSDFSNGSHVSGHVEYIGRCASGCIDTQKKIRIEGNFSVKISRY